MNRTVPILIMLSLICSFSLQGKLRRSRGDLSLPRRHFRLPTDYKKKAAEAPSTSIFTKLAHIFEESKPVVAVAKPEPTIKLQELKRKKLWRKDFPALHLAYLEHPVATTLDLFDDDVQLELSAEDADFQTFLRSQYGKFIDSHSLAPLYIGWVNSIVGYGLFANGSIKRGQYIGECTGRIIPVTSIDPRDAFLFHYPSSHPNKQFVIDAGVEGSLLRFINHDSQPNVDAEYVFHKGLWHLVFIANDNIKEGQQLTLDYGPNYWKNRKEPLPVY